MPRLSRLLASLVVLPFLVLPGVVGCAMDSSDVQNVPPATNAACFGPDGTAQKYAVSQDAYVDLNGVWDRCASTLDDIPADAAGVEFDGKYAYFLVRSAAGALVRGSGTAYQRTVQIRVEAQGIVIVLADDNGGFASYSASIMASPRRLRIENTTSHAYLTLGARP